MTTSPVSRPVSIAAVTAPVLQSTRVGKVQVPWHRDTPLFAGALTSSPQGYSSLDDALSGSARVSVEAGDAAQLIVGSDGRYFAYKLQQPAWEKHGLHEDATTSLSTTFEPAGSGDASNLSFTSYADNGSFTDDPAGRFVASVPGFAGLVSGTTALVDGKLVTVEPAAQPAGPPDAALLASLTEADRLLEKGLGVLATIPADKAAEEPFKLLRKQAYDTDMAAQAQLEKQFQRSDASPEMIKRLRKADANLEDANWQVVTKESPDGRFHGIDIPGAIASTQAAKTIISDYLGVLTKPAS